MSRLAAPGLLFGAAGWIGGSLLLGTDRVSVLPFWDGLTRDPTEQALLTVGLLVCLGGGLAGAELLGWLLRRRQTSPARTSSST